MAHEAGFVNFFACYNTRAYDEELREGIKDDINSLENERGNNNFAIN